MSNLIAITLTSGLLCGAAVVCSAQEAPTGPATPTPVVATPAAAVLSKTARDGFELVESRQFRQAIEYLVRASNEGSKSPAIEEYLFIAYLNVPPSADIKDMLRGANAAARRAIEYGGCAPFIVDRSTTTRFDKNFPDGERGLLRVCKDRIEFKAKRATTTFTIAPADITEFGFNGFKGQTKAAFHIKVKNQSGKKTHDFRPASFSERDVDLLFELMTELWKIHPEQ
jgi:hypothetical protein